LTPNDVNSLPIINGVQNADPGKLAFALGNVAYNADSEVTAEYTIKESTAINGTYDEKATNTVGKVVEFDLSAEGNLHYYQGLIRYRDAK